MSDTMIGEIAEFGERLADATVPRRGRVSACVIEGGSCWVDVTFRLRVGDGHAVATVRLHVSQVKIIRPASI